MTHEHLDNLVRAGNLKIEDATTREISGLIHSGLARLADAKKHTLSPESRFDLAYNSAYALSLASLRIAGYRSGNRYLVFQCLQHTLNLPNEQWRVLEKAHRTRNIMEYEGATEIDESLLEATIRVTEKVAARALNIYSEKFPEPKQTRQKPSDG